MSQTRFSHFPAMVIIVMTLAGAFGCLERQGRPVSPCTNVTVGRTIQVDTTERVDLLFLVDNSGSMREEQASLTEEFPRMIRILASGDFDEDGSLEGPDDFAPVRDLNIGVVTSDMGTADYEIGCDNPRFGDDGVLRSRATPSDDCMAAYPSFLSFRPADEGSADFARDVTCVALAGTEGCGWEQQLEALLKASSPTGPTAWTADHYEAPHFFMDDPGHGDTDNAGFFREDAVLALIPVTDEDDCSVRDSELFDPDARRFDEDLEHRCVNDGEALHGIDRYVDGFIQLRQREGLLVYAPIVGIPLDLVPEPGASPDYERLVGPPTIRDADMVPHFDDDTDELVASCDVQGRGLAYPPVRLVQVAEALDARGAGVTVQSICQQSFAGAMTEIIRTIKGALGAACLPRRLNVDAEGTVACEVLTLMPEGMGCDGVPGGSPQIVEGAEVFEGGRAVCTVDQLAPTDDERRRGRQPSGAGWYYDDYTNEGADNCQRDSSAPFQRIALTGRLPSGAELRLECFQSVQATEDGVLVGTFCDPADGSLTQDEGSCGDGRDPAGWAPLACSPVSRGCGVPCSDDSQCREAGLVGFVCDTRPLESIDDAFAGNTDHHNFCVNPTCS